MHPIERLTKALDTVSIRSDCAFFTLSDLRSVLPELSVGAFKALLSRAAKKNTLKRICRGLYSYPIRCQASGLELYHAAARLRAHEFNYISLETALSDTGVISQIPMHWITIMSSGRSQTIDCNELGHIEFIHTKKKPTALIDKLTYDKQCHLWRATVPLAIDDMKTTKRSLDLIDWSVVDEFI
jgi:predicted transcriptional regulator of viral defense system